MSKQDEYSPTETRKRFESILRGAMHKPTPLKNIPKMRKRKPAKTSASLASRASAKTAQPDN